MPLKAGLGGVISQAISSDSPRSQRGAASMVPASDHQDQYVDAQLTWAESSLSAPVDTTKRDRIRNAAVGKQIFH